LLAARSAIGRASLPWVAISERAVRSTSVSAMRGRHSSNEIVVATAGACSVSSQMPYRRADAEYLREKARRFRRMAAENDTPLSPTLLQIANELDAKADEIEQRPDPRRLQ
jgi:hypothetical protein